MSSVAAAVSLYPLVPVTFPAKHTFHSKFNLHKHPSTSQICCSQKTTPQQQLNLSVLRFTLGIPGLDESYLPRYIGYAFGALLLLNHFVGSDSSSITPAQLRTEVLGISLAAFSAVVPYIGKFLKGNSELKEMVPAGTRSLLLQPIILDAPSYQTDISKGFVLLASSIDYAFTDKDKAWISAIANKFTGMKFVDRFYKNFSRPYTRFCQWDMENFCKGLSYLAGPGKIDQVYCTPKSKWVGIGLWVVVFGPKSVLEHYDVRMKLFKDQHFQAGPALRWAKWKVDRHYFSSLF
ncbi:hypothetical protein CASFOL_008342 [Castilleja foliolosa]|uniref:Uncharacterized protein n=1 Tax=Castilleja foliolosa TaxID=1961234 RepID=A0ABD3E2Q7_9LAMI